MISLWVVFVIVRGEIPGTTLHLRVFPAAAPAAACAKAGSSGSENRGIYRLHQFSKAAL